MQKLVKYLSRSVLAAGLVLSTGPVMMAQPVPAQKPAAQRAAKGAREEHPVIRQAIRELEHTKQLLATKAAHDFKGHRVQAIQSIDQAIAHLNQALAVDTH